MTEEPQQSSVLVSEDSELMGQYIGYTDDALVQLFALYAAMGKATDTADLVEEIHAIAHNIKGMGSSFGFPLMTETSASLCNYLRGLDGGRTASVEIVKTHLDAMRLILDNKITGDGGEAGGRLLGRLKERVAEVG